MAGHSKWNNIKNRKAAVDAKKGKVLGQVARLIRIAVSEGKSDDPKFNPGLRVALDKARQANMPKDKIQKAIDRGMGRGDAGQSREVLYEGFGQGGVAIIVAAITDNPNRTSSEIKYAFSKAGGSLAGPGAAQFMFSRDEEGKYTPVTSMEVDEVTQKSIDALTETLQENDDVEAVFTALD